MNTYYDRFLENFYTSHPELSAATHDEQKSSLIATCFGESDFYSSNIARFGWRATDLIVNCRDLQTAWARENDVEAQGLDIAIEQIKQSKPDVVYFHDLHVAIPSFLDAIRPETGLLVGQIASPVPAKVPLEGLDLIVTSFPHFADRFRQQGITSLYLPLAFEPRVLKRLGDTKQRFELTFIGGFSPAHQSAQPLLERLAERVPSKFWGYGVETLPRDSAIHRCHGGEVWGLEMFSRLSQSRITINRHIDVAGNFANNMRLFEATGCGTTLLTDYKDNLPDLFEIGREVVAYRSVDECIDLARYYLARPEKSQEIGAAGQARTLREHTYENRMSRLAEFLERHLHRVQGKNSAVTPDMNNISTGYEQISRGAVTNSLAAGWRSEKIPSRQRALVQHQLDEVYAGRVPHVFQTFVDALQPCVIPGSSILEIGCASGYYYEVLQYLSKRQLHYTGLDYSLPLLSMARDYYPRVTFVGADAVQLPFVERAFDVVVSSGVLLHLPDYATHVAEVARVARKHVIAHRTPISQTHPTRFFRKKAYGIDSVEIQFSERELLGLFHRNGLHLESTHTCEPSAPEDEQQVTFVFRKHRDRG